MNMIVAADREWGIGKNGDLLDNIPEDMKFFREMTTGKAVIMGAVTFLSLPGQKPLKNRTNIILCDDKSVTHPDAACFTSLEEGVKYAEENFKSEDIFFIGGASIYNQCIKYIDTAYITIIDKVYGADRFIPDFNRLEGWHIASENMQKTEKGLYITFTKYVRD